MKPITTISTPFPEKFGVPRQSLLIPEAWGAMSFAKNDFFAEALRGIEGHSHLWLIFEFHQIPEGPFNGLVRPPRFGGKHKLGVYATRSPHRPNRLGLSVVEFDRVEEKGSEIILWVKGVDLVSGTPIYDIKPYIPYADSVPKARSELFEDKPGLKRVRWEVSPPAEKVLIEKVIALDPRPGHQEMETAEYGVAIAGWNVQFKKEGEELVIFNIASR